MVQKQFSELQLQPWLGLRGSTLALSTRGRYHDWQSMYTEFVVITFDFLKEPLWLF